MESFSFTPRRITVAITNWFCPVTQSDWQHFMTSNNRFSIMLSCHEKLLLRTIWYPHFTSFKVCTQLWQKTKTNTRDHYLFSSVPKSSPNFVLLQTIYTPNIISVSPSKLMNLTEFDDTNIIQNLGLHSIFLVSTYTKIQFDTSFKLLSCPTA